MRNISKFMIASCVLSCAFACTAYADIKDDVVGTWYEEKMVWDNGTVYSAESLGFLAVMTFNADGSGQYEGAEENTDFTWSVLDSSSIEITDDEGGTDILSFDGNYLTMRFADYEGNMVTDYYASDMPELYDPGYPLDTTTIKDSTGTWELDRVGYDGSIFTAEEMDLTRPFKISETEAVFLGATEEDNQYFDVSENGEDIILTRKGVEGASPIVVDLTDKDVLVMQYHEGEQASEATLEVSNETLPENYTETESLTENVYEYEDETEAVAVGDYVTYYFVRVADAEETESDIPTESSVPETTTQEVPIEVPNDLAN